ncbi:NAD(P)-binding protein [Xylona heveae TC161]|uniref:NAD(P)-binding protein n=1 Tax=Xylona heveae (strain CBS 132557 / TC161) TaxID=1328760 RepID=A0A165A0D6_XYLHT|nr:NAD(P)-binding protein [Xylona heveae TC161]KZF19772.1 NAD(P)-binding protein [Xylona heveae TC161]
MSATEGRRGSIKVVAKSLVNAATGKGKDKTILITGASGFVAAHVLHVFLEAGYKVRGTVRSEESAEAVKKSHSQYGEQLSFAIVPDITAQGAFDEAVKNVDGVVHTASPFVMEVKDNNQDLLAPAVKGTTNILKSLHEKNTRVKRLVLTSSFAAMIDIPKGLRPDHTYTEDDWNPVEKDEARSTENGAVAYCASKTFAERAAYEFVEAAQPKLCVTTLCPPMIYGPNLHTVTDIKKLNTSSADIYRLINGSEKSVPDTSFPAFVDVRDVALAHLRAYESEVAGNQRYFLASSTFTYQQVCDIIRENFPELRNRVPEGTPNAPLPDMFKVDHSKAERDLDIHFRSLKDTIVDTVKNLLELEKQLGVTH